MSEYKAKGVKIRVAENNYYAYEMTSRLNSKGKVNGAGQIGLGLWKYSNAVWISQ
ncbi:MAG: hypothetical protein RE471_08760 [Ferroplasma sp.]|uniref:hypothetical protein n=1 Tax=Ferroplasma sp. TaxID=2591003 RepID=UPI0028161DBC|nr:hypothetical protein [Ferroplasma sp.]WMT51054.1 MAG: hypothetical protein RE471_08760 [Ferroplasma sp.]